MSYTIFYFDEKKKRGTIGKRYRRLVLLIVMLSICISIVGMYFQQQTKVFFQTLFPWMKTEVRAAFYDMCLDIRKGNSINDALTTFCMEVIHGVDATS